MTVHDFAKSVRARWKIVCGITLFAILSALAYSCAATPQYEASTRLFVSSTSDGTATQTNDGSIFAQRQVLSYLQLLKGKVLAQRTIDRLNLDMSANELQQRIAASSPADTVVIDVAVTESSATRARDIVNALSDEFVVMAAQLSTPSLGATPIAKVIVQQRADIPAAPVGPKRNRNLLIAVVLGVLLGVVVALIREGLDGRIKSTKALENAARVGLVGDIPFAAHHERSPTGIHGDHSAFAEAFRQLRIYVKTLEIGEGPRVLLIASAMPGEGRTTTAIHLSLALAEVGNNVVLIDGDLRHPSVAALLKIDQGVGFTDVIETRAPLNEALQGTQFPRLTVLGSGTDTDNPTGLLESKAAKEVLRELSETFDYVIVDSPPTLVTDAAIWAGNCQGR